MITSPATESILNELDNPNLFPEEREALQVLARLSAEPWKMESDKSDPESQAVHHYGKI